MSIKIQDTISPFLNSTTIPIDDGQTNANLLQSEGTGVNLDTAENSLGITELETIPEENFGTISIPEDLPSETDDFLKLMADYPLSKDENPYDVASYLRLASKMSKVIQPKKILYNNFDFKAIQPCFGFLPIDSIKKTFECTTQLAKCHTKVPLQKHWQPRFPFLNVQRLSEPVATDTIYSNAKALGGMYVPKASLGHRVV